MKQQSVYDKRSAIFKGMVFSDEWRTAQEIAKASAQYKTLQSSAQKISQNSPEVRAKRFTAAKAKRILKYPEWTKEQHDIYDFKLLSKRK